MIGFVPRRGLDLLVWKEFAKLEPQMSAFGLERLARKVMYLGTIRSDGYPRVHPFTPFVSSGHLFAFMEPTSPKAHDLNRDGRFAMHSLVTDQNGTGGEFILSGRAFQVTDQPLRIVAVQGCPYQPRERYLCFEFMLERCLTNEYVDRNPTVRHWNEDK
ncbi:MAG: pyridoxamine 5'-phosphate oxidase family protein [Thaumarchaeota archaeon]|nr:pyridoxamine 5'-phosphate oxidase family protein [Nitrososphaerota archaeon]